MPNNTLGAGLAHALKARGVDVVFGIPGVHNVELYRGLEQAGITHILARHEQGAGFMADGYARATGRPGVAFTITGPGLTNIMTPMGQAYSDSVPMLVISSCLPVAETMPGQLHQMRDQTGAGACVCDWSELASDGAAAYGLLDRAWGEFSSQRARPKHITVPIDVLESPDSGAPDVQGQAAISPPESDAISRLADMLNAAQKPLFIFGGGAVGASAVAGQLIDKIGGAAFVTHAGRGVIAGDHPLNFGATLARPDSANTIATADLVVAVGTELAGVDLWRDALGHRCPLVRVDIDPDVLGDAHGADLHVQGDAALVINSLLPQLRQGPGGWAAGDVAQTRAHFRAETEAERPGIAALVDALHGVLPPETLLYSDMTQFAYVANEIYPMARPGCWHHPYGFGTLGYALPAAIGGKIARPDDPVLAIAGDYGFQYTLQELGVAAEMNLCLPIILWDNGKLKEIEDAMVRSQIAPNAVVAQNPDFGLLAAAYGIDYTAPTGLSGFRDAVGKSLSANGPTIIHITPDTALS